MYSLCVVLRVFSWWAWICPVYVTCVCSVCVVLMCVCVFYLFACIVCVWGCIVSVCQNIVSKYCLCAQNVPIKTFPLARMYKWHLHLCVCARMHSRLLVCIHMYVCLYVHTHACVHAVCMYLRTYSSMYGINAPPA